MEGGVLYGGQDHPSSQIDTIDPMTGAATAGPAVTGASDLIYGLAPNPLTQGCAVPGSLSTSNVTDTSATLSWDAVSGAIEYQVNYKVVGATKWIVVSSTSNSKTLGGLTPGTNYVWRVRTVCSKSPLVASAYSGQVQFTTNAAGGCEIPTGLFSETTATTAFLQWDDAAGAISYEIMYRRSDDLFWTTVPSQRSFKKLTGLTPRKLYFWKVKSICSGSSSSDYSSEDSFRTFPF